MPKDHFSSHRRALDDLKIELEARRGIMSADLSQVMRILRFMLSVLRFVPDVCRALEDIVEAIRRLIELIRDERETEEADADGSREG